MRACGAFVSRIYISACRASSRLSQGSPNSLSSIHFVVAPRREALEEPDDEDQLAIIEGALAGDRNRPGCLDPLECARGSRVGCGSLQPAGPHPRDRLAVLGFMELAMVQKLPPPSTAIGLLSVAVHPFLAAASADARP